jgi:flagellar basal-body rod protein FlgG
MIRSLSIAKTGLDAQQTQLDVISNNLANVGTTGFKRSRAVFEDLMYQNLRQSGGQTSDQTRMPSGLQMGTGVRVVATERIHTQGTPTKTDNSKDVAINGNGFFQVLMPDGTTAYTRDGSFQQDQNGQLVTASGFPVQPAITLPQNPTSMTRYSSPHFSTPPVCKATAKTCIRKPMRPVRPTRPCQARTAPARSIRVTSRRRM